VRQVRELARQWQRDNEAQFGPFLHPVEDEESWKKFLTFLRISGILFVMKVKDTTEETQKEMKLQTQMLITLLLGLTWIKLIILTSHWG